MKRRGERTRASLLACSFARDRKLLTRARLFPPFRRNISDRSCKVPANLRSCRSLRLARTLPLAAPPPLTRHRQLPPPRLCRARLKRDSHFVLALSFAVPRRISASLRRKILRCDRSQTCYSRPPARSGDTFAWPPPEARSFRFAENAHLPSTRGPRPRARPAKQSLSCLALPTGPGLPSPPRAAGRRARGSCCAERSTALNGRRRQARRGGLCPVSLDGIPARWGSPLGPNRLGPVASLRPPLNASAFPGDLNGRPAKGSLRDPFTSPSTISQPHPTRHLDLRTRVLRLVPLPATQASLHAQLPSTCSAEVFTRGMSRHLRLHLGPF